MLDMVKIVVVLSIIIIVSKKLSLGISLIIGSMVIGLLFSIDMFSWIHLIHATLKNDKMWELLLVFIAIGIFASSMEVFGLLDQMISNLQKVVHNPKTTAALIPMMIGMVNIPGGAYISAPFVGQATKNLTLTQENKSAINIVFRHFWYPVYPIFPAMVLLHELSGVSIRSLIIFGMPSVIISSCLSWWVCFKNIEDKKYKKQKVDIKIVYSIRLFTSVLPLISIVISILIIELSYLQSILIGILNVILLSYRQFKMTDFKKIKHKLLSVIQKSMNWKILVIPFGIYFFRNAIEQVQVIDSIVLNIAKNSDSVLLLALSLSIIVSFLTAYHLAAIGIVSPIIIPLLSSSTYDIGIFLILIGTIIGYFISPLHTCTVLSNDYFNSNYIKTARKIFVSAFGILMGALLVMWLY